MDSFGTGTQGKLDWRRVARLVRVPLAIVLTVVALRVVPIWLMALIPRSVMRGAAIGFLQSLLVAYGVALVGAPAGLVILGVWSYRARSRGQKRPLLARLCLLCASILIGLACLEGVASVFQSRRHRIDLPTRFVDDAGIPPRTTRAGAGRAHFSLVVAGESSARGEPYQPLLSVGQIVAWQLERVLPGLSVDVDMRAMSGLRLDLALIQLKQLTRRPDAILLYAGHNEFQGRYWWGRSVPYYRDDNPPRSRLYPTFLDQARSPLCELITETLDAQRVDLPPPPRATRSLVDRPTCSEGEYATVLRSFRQQLETFVGYCERIGALPILIIPPGDDGGFEPNRSVLAPECTRAEREAFEREFQRIRAREQEDIASSLARYRTLLKAHPGFAEAHFRLARLLESSGQSREADRHYIQARDLDGLPLRCPTRLQEVYRSVAARHDCILIDGPAVLRARSPDGLVNYHLFHDAQHPNLIGYIALAQELMEQLRRRATFDWPAQVRAPRIDPVECADHFGIDAGRWEYVCAFAQGYHEQTASIRFDPTERLAVVASYKKARQLIAEGRPPEQTGLPGLGPEPTWGIPGFFTSPASGPL